MDIREVLALNLKKCRRARRLSQEELAHRAEIDRTYISSIERCIYAASIDVVDRLARVLDLEAADLLKDPARVDKNREIQGAATVEPVELITLDADASADNRLRRAEGANPRARNSPSRDGKVWSRPKSAKPSRREK